MFGSVVGLAKSAQGLLLSESFKEYDVNRMYFKAYAFCKDTVSAAAASSFLSLV